MLVGLRKQLPECALGLAKKAKTFIKPASFIHQMNCSATYVSLWTSKQQNWRKCIKNTSNCCFKCLQNLQAKTLSFLLPVGVTIYMKWTYYKFMSETVISEYKGMIPLQCHPFTNWLVNLTMDFLIDGQVTLFWPDQHEAFKDWREVQTPVLEYFMI